MRKLRLLTGAISICLAGSVLAGAPTYSLIDLGTGPVGSMQRVNGINDNDQVVGYSNDNGFLRPWYWSQGTGMQTFGTTGNVHVSPTGITNFGRVYGNEQGVGYLKGFQWQSGGSYSFFSPVPGGGDTLIDGVDRGGNVLFNIGGSSYIYDGTTANLIDPIASQGVARMVNGSGQVGGYHPNGHPDESFLWTAGSGYDYTGTFIAGGTVIALGLNNPGYLTGYADTTDGMRAFLWSNGFGLLNLGALSTGAASLSRGYSVNDSLQVVGQSDIKGQFTAFYWDSTGGMVNLLDLVDASGTGWHLLEADSINNGGQIVGVGLVNGETHAFLLSPTASSVPGPAAAIPWVLGTAAVWLRRRRSWA